MQHHLSREGKTLAYTDKGEGPLTLIIPGVGDLQEEYRFLRPRWRRPVTAR